jgi:signal transduction histidine kinase
VIAAVIDEARQMAEERQVTLSIETIADGSVCCTMGILSSLVSNLVRNGVKYVGEGTGKKLSVRANTPGGGIRIEVEDNGPGLPAAMEAAVFEPYVRGPDNHQPGIGLGLATVKRVAEAHGGRVDVRSIAHVGCRFGLELPCAAETSTGAASKTRDEKALPPPSSPPRVGPEDERRRDVPAEDTNPSSHPG